MQEKKRELANQTIEGGKGGAGKLGMKEIMQLFRRDAEHGSGDPKFDLDLGKKTRILKEREAIGSQQASREGTSSREKTPVFEKPGRRKEDAVFGRRW